MYIKRSIRFSLNQRKKDGVLETKNISVRMRIAFNGSRTDIPIGHRVDESAWDKKNERVLAGFINKYGQTHNDINRTIDNYKSNINEVFARYELIEKRVPTLEEIIELFNDLSGRTKQDDFALNNDFFHIWDLFTRTVGQENEWTPATFTKFKSLRLHIETYDKKIQLQEIDNQYLLGFVQYLKKDMRNTTIAKQIDNVKWFLRWAAANGYYTGKAHLSFKPKLKGADGNSKEVIYLSWDEIQTMQNIEFNENQNYLSRVRDVFLFCCFTGLRYSDVAKLKKSDVKDGHIIIVTKKTVDGIKIELNKYSQAILDKYKDYKFDKQKVLPVISNVKMNEYLKELGQICEYNEQIRIVYFKGNERIEEVHPKWALLTTHCGRRSFVVNALYLGIPSEVIIKWTGHSDFKAMKPYVKIVDELKEREMSKFNDIETVMNQKLANKNTRNY